MIQLEAAGKSIKGKEILKDLSFEIHRGECVALIGPNGAGKTTLLDCLLGENSLSEGAILLAGKKLTDQALKEEVAILPQENQVVPKLTVIELIRFFREIYHKPLSLAEIDRLLNFTEDQKRIS